jgi:hypothetical protein
VEEREEQGLGRQGADALIGLMLGDQSIDLRMRQLPEDSCRTIFWSAMEVFGLRLDSGDSRGTESNPETFDVQAIFNRTAVGRAQA